MKRHSFSVGDRCKHELLLAHECRWHGALRASAIEWLEAVGNTVFLALKGEGYSPLLGDG